MREASYTSFRLGLYAPLKHAFGADKPDSPFIMKFAAGGASGGTRPGVAIDFWEDRVEEHDVAQASAPSSATRSTSSRPR